MSYIILNYCYHLANSFINAICAVYYNTVYKVTALLICIPYKSAYFKRVYVCLVHRTLVCVKLSFSLCLSPLTLTDFSIAGVRYSLVCNAERGIRELHCTYLILKESFFLGLNNSKSIRPYLILHTAVVDGRQY